MVARSHLTWRLETKSNIADISKRRLLLLAKNRLAVQENSGLLLKRLLRLQGNNYGISDRSNCAGARRHPYLLSHFERSGAVDARRWTERDTKCDFRQATQSVSGKGRSERWRTLLSRVHARGRSYAAKRRFSLVKLASRGARNAAQPAIQEPLHCRIPAALRSSLPHQTNLYI